MTKLADIAQVNPRLDASLADDEPVSFLGMADVSERGTTSLGGIRPYRTVKNGFTPFSSGDILVAKITPCFENGKIAQATTSLAQAFGSTEFHVVHVDEEAADTRYILHFLRTPQLRLDGELRMTGSAGQRRVPKTFLERLEIPLPPLAEQRRIAALLDQTVELLAMRRLSLTLLDDLVDSTFAELQNANNAGSIESVSIRELAEVQTGPFGSLLHKEDYVSGGVSLVNPMHIKNGQIVPDSEFSVAESKLEQLERFELRPGDVVLARRGEMGRAAEVLESHGRLICGTGSMTIRPKRGIATGAVLARFLSSPSARRQLEQAAQGVTMLNLNQSIVGGVRLSIPDYVDQLAFTQTRDDLNSQKNLFQSHLAYLDELFASLQHFAFGGEL